MQLRLIKFLKTARLKELYRGRTGLQKLKTKYHPLKEISLAKDKGSSNWLVALPGACWKQKGPGKN